MDNKINKNINPYFLLKYSSNVHIIEDCNFFSTSIVVKNNNIYLGRYGFTGVGGSLPLKFSEHINSINSSKKFLQFLSFLSSYILQLRFKYISKLLPSNNGLIGMFVDKLIGLNISKKGKRHLCISKNINNFNLRYILKKQYKISIEIKKFSLIFIPQSTIKLTNKTPWYRYLGKRIPIIANKIIIQCNSYNHLREIYRQQKEIKKIIHQFYNFYQLVFKTSEKKISNQYIISSKIIH
ncbi:hypothetical protein AB836_00195 [Rickettsiales bacterium (ex Bugula neritina AB1)]|nr:hypothetical protein AB836_00195 [Rickettsiales bacterium (ex Bugula neritina AB1)]